MKIRIARPTGKYSKWAPEWKYISGARVTQTFETVPIQDDRITGKMFAKLEKILGDSSDWRFIETSR